MSHRLANALVGNDRDAATLEMTLLGPELEFEDERLAAVAGAEFEIVARRPSGAARDAVPGAGGVAPAVRAAAARLARLPGDSRRQWR